MKYKMEELSVEITYKCPMNCLHCSSRAEIGNETMIPTEKILEMIGRCKMYCGTTDVSLSGGEPFEHPDFWKILKHIKAQGLKSIVYSCGIEKDDWFKDDEYNYISFSDKRIKKLQKLCDVLIISLHGTPTTHNEIMNIGHMAFGCATNTIRKAVAANIRVGIHFVPTKINYKDMKIIYGLCMVLGITKMSILRYVPQGRGLETSEEHGEINLDKEEFLEMQKDMKHLKRISQNSMPIFRVGIPADFTFLLDFYEDGILNAKKERACTGGKVKILVKADGKVQVCPAWKELDHLSAGDIYKEDIVKIWKKGRTYCKFREFTYKDLEEPCKSCIFVKSCLGGCGAQRILNSTMNIDGLKTAPDPLCFYGEIESTRGNFLKEKVKWTSKWHLIKGGKNYESI
ncbi:hypothetical protein LCGC14_1265740 [marine sediment metagenome]|uniref:Radical SAM core domain-containing protein n=1 Tax=marine sediment metagenome TaxID=412755 RepID=A0A0F9NG89_9ZZZZ